MRWDRVAITRRLMPLGSPPGGRAMSVSLPSRIGCVLSLAALMCAGTALHADPPKKETVAPPMAALEAKDWLKASTAPLEPGELDRLIGDQLKKVGIKPAPIANDELFLRRVYLDLTGRLPMPADIKDF